MKKYLQLMLLILSVWLPSQICFSFSVVTMNLHCYEDEWEFRFVSILNELIARNPEVLVFQEVCSKMGSDPSLDSQMLFIRDYLNTHGYPVRTFNFQYTHPAWGKFDEYLLSVSRRESAGVDQGLLPKSLMQRGFIGLKIDDLWVINTHLEFRADNESARREQLGFLQQRFRDKPHLLGGDFNSSPSSAEQSELWAQNYKPIFPGPTFNGDDGNASETIDGFWISETVRQRFHRQTGWVLLNSRVQGRYLSDHFAVQLSLDFSKHGQK